MAEEILVVSGVSKVYRLWRSPGDRLWVPLAQRLRRLAPGAFGAMLDRFIEQRLSHFRALHDVSFRMRRGQSLGIVGLNGSGKSTLLQIIAGVLPPTGGSVQVIGRIAALLELGSGFSPDLTGRENARINASILGLSGEEIDRVLPSIIEFADLGGFIDQPVRTYSTGMAARLAFAVQAHVEPDVLIVDEALAVGDAVFQAKAMGRIEQVLARGATLLFVGHDLNAVRTFCDRALLLEAGCIAMDGDPESVIEEYLYRIHARTPAATQGIQRTPEGFRTGQVGAIEARFEATSEAHVSVRYADVLRAIVELHVEPSDAALFLVFDILDERGVPLTGRRIPLPPTSGGGTREVTVEFPAQFQKGVYRLRLRIIQPTIGASFLVFARHETGLSFDVVDDNHALFSGAMPLPFRAALGGGADDRTYEWDP